MDKSEEQKHEGSTVSMKRRIVSKVFITVARLIIILLDLWCRNFDVSQCVLSILVLGGCFMLS